MKMLFVAHQRTALLVSQHAPLSEDVLFVAHQSTTLVVLQCASLLVEMVSCDIPVKHALSSPAFPSIGGDAYL